MLTRLVLSSEPAVASALQVGDSEGREQVVSGSAHKLRSGDAAPHNMASPGDDITGVQRKSPRSEEVQLPSLQAPPSGEAQGPAGAGTTTPPVTKRKRKLGPARAEAKARTREAILDAACALFSEEGFDQPGLDTICSVAGRTRGAYNVHFRSREDLISTVALRAVEQVERRVCGSSHPRQQLDQGGSQRVLLESLLARVDEEQLPPMLLLHAVARYPAVREGYLAALERMTQHLTDAAQAQIASGKMRVDATPRQTALMLTALLTGLDTLESLGLGGAASASPASGGAQAVTQQASAGCAPSREQLVELLSVLLKR